MGVVVGDVLGVVVGASGDPVPVARSGAIVPNARLIRGLIDLVSRDLVSPPLSQTTRSLEDERVGAEHAGEGLLRQMRLPIAKRVHAAQKVRTLDRCTPYRRCDTHVTD